MKYAIIGAVVSVIIAIIVVSFGNLGDNLVYYWKPSETLAKGAAAKGSTIRLGGVVQAGSVNWSPQTLELKFRVADGIEPGAPSVLVDSKGAPPQMFREGIGVVVEGQLDGELFKSDRVLVNHSNEYTPPTGAEATANYGAGSLR